jgi:hypothetical protein
MIVRLFIFIFSALAAINASAGELTQKLEAYRKDLGKFRAEYGVRELPDVRFFLFGMGGRDKFIYRDGKLLFADSGKVFREWKYTNDWIVPSEYTVALKTTEGKFVYIGEDEKSVWITENDNRTNLYGTVIQLHLPDFKGHKYARLLRVLHQELLINVTPTGPVPNFFVYKKPWYRDGAMMAMALQKTRNVATIRDWIGALNDPFDRNNAGEAEADNLGEALYLISLASDRKHPLVEKILSQARRFEKTDNDGRKYISGRSDFAPHPAYQTKWMKFGLHALNLADPYIIPAVNDSYSALFWIDYHADYFPGKDADDRNNYPYLGWACDHFHRVKKSPIGNRDYPLTWEQNASQADYTALKILDPIYAEQKLATPHTWHAAEIFLYLLDQK